MKAKFYKRTSKWRILIPPRITGTTRKARFFETEEEARKVAAYIETNGLPSNFDRPWDSTQFTENTGVTNDERGSLTVLLDQSDIATLATILAALCNGETVEIKSI